ncbi:MAG: hypothetical protein WBD40_16125, partial [Tepidisphaeraceae bacterium]
MDDSVRFDTYATRTTSQEAPVKQTTTMTAGMIALMCAMTAVGCSSTNKDPQMTPPNASVTDVSVTPAAQPLEAPAPIAQPVI